VKNETVGKLKPNTTKKELGKKLQKRHRAGPPYEKKGDLKSKGWAGTKAQGQLAG